MIKKFLTVKQLADELGKTKAKIRVILRVYGILPDATAGCPKMPLYSPWNIQLIADILQEKTKSRKRIELLVKNYLTDRKP